MLWDGVEKGMPPRVGCRDGVVGMEKPLVQKIYLTEREWKEVFASPKSPLLSLYITSR